MGLMLVYIWFRFEWQFGVAAVAALLHDVVISIGFFGATQMEFSLTTIAALLTIVGYSINDTVVVFDRIREDLRRFKTRPVAEVLNTAINDTLSRTTMTSFTTLIALFALLIFGGEVIRSFVAAMIWGIVVGTYSSIFVAAPLLLWLGLEKQRRRAATGAEGMAEPAE
jgi:preprotein translocase SecF subunit